VDDLIQLEQLTDQHLRDNNREEAVRALYELIIGHAKRKNFAKAEELRERLIQIDSMALSEIITSAEIIEEEKKQSRPKDHMKTWESLYSLLSNEEANTLYYSMKEGNTFGTDSIFRQGQRNTNLYFLNEGQLIMVCNQGEKEIALRMYRAGEIMGEDTFFHDSLCTTSLRTFTRARYHYLEKDVLSKWTKEHPALEQKIRGYCDRFEKVHDLLKRKGLDRRSDHRYRMPGKGIIQVLSNTGTPVGSPVKGDLADVSAKGLCFYIRLSKKETARLLLGRRLSLRFAVQVDNASLQIDQTGLVVAVLSHPFDDYTVHVRFDETLGKEVVENLALLSARTASSRSKVTIH
jgi:CRP-like cAMP-binding protein